MINEKLKFSLQMFRVILLIMSWSLLMITTVKQTELELIIFSVTVVPIDGKESSFYH